MTCNVVPGDAVPVLVVEDGETGLVVELLKALDRHTDVELGLDRALGQTLVVVWLSGSTPGEKHI